MTKTATLLVVSFIVLGSFAFMPSRAKAQGAAPEWTSGDYWEYGGQGQYQGYQVGMTMRMTVGGRASMMVGTHTYDTYRCDMTMSISVPGMTASVTGASYYRVSDFADVKTVMRMSIPGATMSITIAYDPPRASYRFPLSNGQEWTSISNETTTTDGTTTNRTVTFDFEVAGPKSISVPAGTFDTFEVTGAERGSPSNVSSEFYSDKVGNAVRTSALIAGFSIPLTIDLKSYNYQKMGLGIWLIVLTVVIIVVVVAVAVALVVRARRKARMLPPQQPPMLSYGQPPQQPPYQPPPPPPP